MKRGGKQAEANRVKGDASVKAAKKAASTGLLKWKPDWEDAARHYRDAVKAYAVCDSPALHLKALEDSIGPHEKIGDVHTCGKHLETAAKIYEKELNPPAPKKAFDCYTRASTLFRTNEQHDKAAGLLLAAATTLGTSTDATATSKRTAYGAITASVDIFRQESRANFANEHFKKCVSLAIQLDMLDEAVELLQEQNSIYMGMLDDFESDVYKGIVSIVVILFHKQQYLEAEKVFKEGEQKHNFMMSEEWSAASALFDAFKAGSMEDLTAAVKKSTFQYLPSRIARLARKLKFSAEVLKNGGVLQLDQPASLEDFLDGHDENGSSDDEEPDFS